MFLVSLLASLSWSASFAERTAEAPEPLRLKFGVYSTDHPRDVYKSFSRVLEAVQAGVKAKLDREVEVDLRIYETYDAAIDALVRGEVDFSRFGPASYLHSWSREKEILLLAMEEKKGARRFNGHVVVRKDSDVQSLEDLEGRSFAFGDENSTIGRYLVQSAMVDAGLYAKDLSSYQYLGRHDKVFQAVALGSFEAGALKESTFEKMNKLGQLRVLYTFENVTKPWIGRAGLQDGGVARALSEALCDIEDPAVLEAYGVTAFAPASRSEYEFVQRGMKNSYKFTASKGSVEGRTKVPAERSREPRSKQGSKER